MRHTYQSICTGRLALSNSESTARGLELLDRATELDLAATAYLTDVDRAKAEAGIPAAEARAEAASRHAEVALRALALTRAQTGEGVAAKLDAVAHTYPRTNLESRDPDKFDEDHVLQAVALDAAELLKNREA